MSDDHNGLNEDRLGSLNSRYLYLSRSHRKALASLYYGIEKGGGFQLILADEGVGKTTLLRYLQGRLQKHSRPIYLSATDCKEPGFLASLIDDLENGSADRGPSSYQDLIVNVGTSEEEPTVQRSTLLVDDAQELDNSELDIMLSLSQREAFKEKRLHVVLAGLPSLLDKLTHSNLIDRFEQVWLAPLEDAEIEGYSFYRQRMASASPDSMSASAISAPLAKKTRETRGISNNSFTTWIEEESQIDHGNAFTRQTEGSNRHTGQLPAISSSSSVPLGLRSLVTVALIVSALGLWYEFGRHGRPTALIAGHERSLLSQVSSDAAAQRPPRKQSLNDKLEVQDSAGIQTPKAGALEGASALPKENDGRLRRIVPEMNEDGSRSAPGKSMAAKAASMPFNSIATIIVPATPSDGTSESTPIESKTSTVREHSEASTAPHEALTSADIYRIRVRTDVGDDYMRLGQYEKAITFYEDALAISPDNERLQRKIKRARLAKAAEDQVLPQ
jgi:type II secretory pathway predicted ATPase ExeA